MIRPDEDCWQPPQEPEDEIAGAHAAINGVALVLLVAISVYVSIEFFMPDDMHEPPVEIGEIEP